MHGVPGEGLEPSFTGSKPVVLPLDDPGVIAAKRYTEGERSPGRKSA